jgi:hypothetical protein
MRGVKRQGLHWFAVRDRRITCDARLKLCIQGESLELAKGVARPALQDYFESQMK